tara:strand:+ start:71 stop:484 length:414 start_codon:yes stop_codon:yes gene_type:complete
MDRSRLWCRGHVVNPFEYVNAINNTKKDIMIDDIAERGYNSFMVNRSLSYFNDTVLYANEMNIHHNIDNRLQFDFLINMVRKRKRFSKWEKVASESDVEVVKEYYGYNNEKARSALSLLTRENINELKKKVYKGGRK